ILLYVVGILFMLIGLALSIGLHEIGHLVPAKLFGVRVGQYMIGFGPRLWSKRIGETEYGFKALPLGGFISMSGMYPASDGKPARWICRTRVQDARSANDETFADGGEDRVFYRLPVFKRVIVMLGGPAMTQILAVLIFTVLASGIGLQQGTTTIASVNECVLPAGTSQTECEPDDHATPAAEAGALPGDVLVSIDGTPVSDFAEATALVQAAAGQRLDTVVERDGETINLMITPIAVERALTDASGQPKLDADGDQIVAEVGYVGMSSQMGYVRQSIGTGPAMTAENVGRVASIIATLPVR